MESNLTFDGVSLDRFWPFLAERQRIWHRRSSGAPPPWTEDPILSGRHFTNVYRELDPGTEFARREILDRPGRQYPFPERLFNLMIYRLAFTEDAMRHVWACVGWLRPQEFSATSFRDAMLSYPGSVFTSAYMVCGYEGGRPKLDILADLFAAAGLVWKGLVDQLLGAETPQEAWRVLHSLRGWGPFIAYQCLVDLTYPWNAARHLMLDQDEWAYLGPGAVLGLSYLRGGKTPRSLHVQALQRLRALQGAELTRRNFQWLREPDGRNRVLSLCNLANGLCEFSKYRRLSVGIRGARARHFAPAESYAADRLEAAVAGEPQLPIYSAEKAE